MKLPLIVRLKKEAHKNVAEAQDMIVRELYSVFDDAVLHGGTAIWRCYQGNRFSEDIDVYLSKDVNKINTLFLNLQKKGFLVEKKKITEHSLYSRLKWNRTFVELEALFKKVNGCLKEYETAEGNLVSVYTLTPEELISEKIDTYLGRRKIRDLYDIFFLLKYIIDFREIKAKAGYLIKNFNPPIDEKELKVLILEGLVPTSQKMMEYIKNTKWEKRNI
ncbi:nucleotidyl transferase AbiEii/AbiGii toxin family protein [Candidatus Woesearchaeota archaeon]|nr:nucleotidyl transferase AbiEii/AbiGii toxin family protein [Candidatus Woesearchaeota archaeon]